MSSKDENIFKHFELSSEVYILINEDPELSFTSRSVKEIIEEIHGAYFPIARVRDILNQLARRKRIEQIRQQTKDNPGKNHIYKANKSKPKILIGSPAYYITKTIIKLKDQS